MPFIKVDALDTQEAKHIAVIFKGQQTGTLPTKYFEKTLNTESICYYQRMDCLTGDPPSNIKHAVICYLASGHSLLVLLPINEFEELIK